MLEIALSQLQPLLLPLSGDRQPIDAAAPDDQLGFEALGLQEQALEFRVSKVLRVRLVRPGGVQALKEKRVGVSHPKARLRCEPVQPLEPSDGRLKSLVIEHFRLVRFLFP